MAKAVYRITYPNGKIYVGKDLTGTLTYFGSPDARLIAADFPADQRRDFTVRKEILWESETASDADVSRREVQYIRALRSNDPAVGYNRWPRFPTTPEAASAVLHGDGARANGTKESQPSPARMCADHADRDDGVSREGQLRAKLTQRGGGTGGES